MMRRHQGNAAQAAAGAPRSSGGTEASLLNSVPTPPTGRAPGLPSEDDMNSKAQVTL